MKENGTAVILASVLAQLKNDQLLLPALNVLVAISRNPVHITTLVREGGVPAVLAAILAHLRRVEVSSHRPLVQSIPITPAPLPGPRTQVAQVAHYSSELYGTHPSRPPQHSNTLLPPRPQVLRAALIVLRNIVVDDQSALRLGGQGAYRIVLAVLQVSPLSH